MHTIMLVDDKVSITQLLREYLEKHGYRVVVAHNGRDAIFLARHERPDLIVLDIMMPEMDGLEFMKLYRRERLVPIILLTAKPSEADKIVGLELGADDYITKPFSVNELLARVRAVLRRAANQYDISEVLRVGVLTIDKGHRTVCVGDIEIDLTATEFDLLCAFMEAPGRVFSRSELLDHLQGDTFDGVEGTINVHVHNLRNKIEPEPRSPQFILTVYGMGYRFTTMQELTA